MTKFNSVRSAGDSNNTQKLNTKSNRTKNCLLLFSYEGSRKKIVMGPKIPVTPWLHSNKFSYSYKLYADLPS